MQQLKPNFTENASNVYRTKDFIVKQELSFGFDASGTNHTFSRDTYYARTGLRDLQYELYFVGRERLDGKRLPSTIYTRKYVQ